MGPEKKIKLAFGLVVSFLALGTIGYVLIDHYSPLEAFYMTVITISTVGYGEIRELSELGRIFTIFLILSGVGCIAFLAGAFTELIMERAANPNRWKKVMDKKIGKLEGHVIICGHGRVGASAAEYFQENTADFVVVENSSEELKNLAELGYLFLEGDGTREETLLRAGIKKASALLAVLNSDPDNLFVVLTARELNPMLKIIARIEHPTSESRILRAGADSIISPFVAAGKKVAKSLLGTTAQESVDGLIATTVVENLNWLNVREKGQLVGETVRNAESLLNMKVVGIRRKGRDVIYPELEIKLQLQDKLLVIAKEDRAKELSKESNPPRIVIIDDNPVIIRLYTRLFQKAGFDVHTALTGESGFSLVKQVEPDGAVVDFHLPDISGLEVCERIRRELANDTIKLFLFTAEDEMSLEKDALKEGVDEVVRKSPDAGEIIAKVVESLSKSGVNGGFGL